MKKMTAARLTAGLLLVSTLVSPALALTGTVDAGGSTLRVRSEASTSGKVLGKLKDGAQVDVLSVADSGWYQISYKNTTGYISNEYVVLEEALDHSAAAVPAFAPNQAPPSQDIIVEKAPEQAAPAESTPADQSDARYCRVTTSVLNIRSGPGTGYAKTGSLRAGKVVEILGETDGWYKVDGGYISAEYTVIADPSSSSKGQEIADYALQFVGYPYVYGGSTPKGFDCSGFTKYVYAQFGYSINRTASNQLDNGTPVSMAELQPGDLVMFQKYSNSSKRASHVGIYIGGGQFVHASTAKVGVIVSNMSDAYYTTGFVGGRRLV